MYHQIAENSHDNLTVSFTNLEKQFQYLSEKKYKSIFFSQLGIKNKKKIIITFDDGYKNNYDYLPALLEKYNLKASLFIATDFIINGYKDYEMMTFDELRSLNPDYFEIGLHSHSHKNFRECKPEFIKKDLETNKKILSEAKVIFSNVLAYPYGKYPKRNTEKQQLFSVMEDCGLKYAVRIGNKINNLSVSNPYELCRIDIKGSDSLEKFKLKLIFGRLKLF